MLEDQAGWIRKLLLEPGGESEGIELGSGTYGCSFSSGDIGVEDDLTYWRLYGNDGEGCSLKISRLSSTINLYRVRYRKKGGLDRSDKEQEEDKEVADRVRPFIDLGKETMKVAPDEVKRKVAAGLHRVIQAYYHLVKHVAYSKENEWRLVIVGPRPDQVKFDTTREHEVRRYVDGPDFAELLSSNSVATVGPTVGNPTAARAYLEHLIRKHGIKYVKVRNSHQTYRQGPRRGRAGG